MILRKLAVLVALLPFTLADVEFTSPDAGQSISGLSIDVEWKDSGNDPPLSDLSTYQMFLCAGGNEEGSYIQLATLVQQGDFGDGNSYTAKLTSGLGADETNAYFIKIMSAATGGTVTNFSPRFSLTGMIGTFPPSVTAGLKSVSGTKGPATINQVSSPQVGAVNPAAAGGAQFNVPYTMQTGAVRYAPMPIQPPTKISLKNFSPLYPTSAYTAFQTKAPPPQVATSTATAPATFVVQSRIPTMAAQSQPAPAMAKFLNRWKD